MRPDVTLHESVRECGYRERDKQKVHFNSSSQLFFERVSFNKNEVTAL